MTYPEVTSDDSFTKRDQWYMKKQKEELRNRMKNMKHKEYQNLRIMVPSIAFKPNVSKVTVIEEAVRYIDLLHVALLTKLEEQESKAPEFTETSSVQRNGMRRSSLSEAGVTPLELVKKADFSLYSKLHEQMQAFATKTFCLTNNFDVESMVKGPVDFAMK